MAHDTFRAGDLTAILGDNGSGGEQQVGGKRRASRRLASGGPVW